MAWRRGCLRQPLTLSGLRNGTSYSFEVRAVNVVGARTVRARPGRAVVGGAASLVGADIGNGSAITDYVVQRSTSVEGPWTTITDGVGTTLAATVGGLTNGTTYRFRVAAVNAAGTGADSAVAEATPFTTPDAPVVSSISSADGGLVVDLGASSDGGADLIRYEYRLNGTGSWSSVGSAEEPFTIEGLINGTTYGVEVRGERCGRRSGVSERHWHAPIGPGSALDLGGRARHRRGPGLVQPGCRWWQPHHEPAVLHRRR